MSTPQPSPFPRPEPEPAPTDPSKAKKARRWPWIVGVVAALIVGVVIGQSTSGSTPTNTAATAPKAGATATVTAPAKPAEPTTVTVTAPAPVQAAAPAQPAAPEGPATSFGDGTYKVGTDIAPGSYKTTGPRDPGGHCYWQRARDDAGNDIIANNLGTGQDRLTTKSGEYLQITGCDWTKS